MDFAEELGRRLGQAHARASSLLDQRQAVSKRLVEIRDMANQLLAQLGHQAEAVAGAVRREGRKAPTRTTSRAKAAKSAADPSKAPGKKKRGPGTKRSVSEESRRKTADAAKARMADRQKSQSPAGNR
jgi:hypothetical protein